MEESIRSLSRSYGTDLILCLDLSQFPSSLILVLSLYSIYQAYSDGCGMRDWLLENFPFYLNLIGAKAGIQGGRLSRRTSFYV